MLTWRSFIRAAQIDDRFDCPLERTIGEVPAESAGDGHGEEAGLDQMGCPDTWSRVRF